jgi:hypothetical protein
MHKYFAACFMAFWLESLQIIEKKAFLTTAHRQ